MVIVFSETQVIKPDKYILVYIVHTGLKNMCTVMCNIKTYY